MFYDAAEINVVKAFCKGKCPPAGGEWERHRAECVPESQLYEWFGPGTSYCSISAVTGPISGGLTVIHSDSAEAYHVWAKRNPELAKLLEIAFEAAKRATFPMSELVRFAEDQVPVLLIRLGFELQRLAG